MPDDQRPDNPESDPLVRRPRRERRAPRGSPGSLHWLREMLGRPLVLERHDQSMRLVLRERRRRPEVIRAQALHLLCQELRQRLEALDSATARRAMRHLLAVCDTLLLKGWPDVEALPARVLGKAVVQAQMIAGSQASKRLLAFMDHLCKLQVAAEVREDRRPQPARRGPDSALEVAETTPEAYSHCEREWVGIVVESYDDV